MGPQREVTGKNKAPRKSPTDPNIAPGVVVTDVAKKQWKIGKRIGKCLMGDLLSVR